MTFKGQSYASIIDLEKLIIIWEAELEAYKIELKTYTLTRNKAMAQETAIIINCYENGLHELRKLESSLISKIDALCDSMDDNEGKVFIMKFIKGKKNQQIIDTLHISSQRLFQIQNNISRLLDETEYGNDIKESLKE